MRSQVNLGALQPLNPVDRITNRWKNDPVRRNTHFQKFNLGAATYDAHYARGYSQEYLAYLEPLVRKAAERGVELLLLPEFVFMAGVLAAPGEGVKANPRAFADALNLYAWSEKLFLRHMADVARKSKMFIAFSIPSARNGKLYNSGVILDRRGRVAGRYDKIHLAPGPEATHFTAGTRYSIIETVFGRVSFCICYDLFFPEAVACCAALGTRIILHPSNGYTFPDESPGMGQRRLQVRASDHCCAVVYSSFARGRRGSPGESAVIGPNGDVLAMVPADRQGLAHGTARFGANSSRRLQLRGARIPETYGTLIKE